MALRPALFWIVAALLAAASWRFFGWPGLALAVSVTVFVLLLQVTRALRVMRVAADMPMACVASAVMFQSRLRHGLTMLQVVAATKSLGREVEGGADDWEWCDDGGDCVRLCFEHGRLVRWKLVRPAATIGEPPT